MPSSLNPRDVATIDLGRVLSRLEHKILSADTADPRLQHSSYERTKTSANLEYARTLLLRLEHSSSSLKLPSQRASAQSSLSAQRALIKRLTDRLHDLEAHGDDDDLLYGPEDEEDILGEDPPASAPLAVQHQPEAGKPAAASAIEEPISILRNRKQPSSKPPATAVSTDSRETTQAELLTHNDAESANLTTSLLALAQSLKVSSAAFSNSLETDTEVLNRATEGLDKSATGMDAAGKRIGLLKRMSEGKGWWGRMMLYAWIGGLWVLAILLVFAGPKLRF